jgi:hypothetical protein
MLEPRTDSRSDKTTSRYRLPERRHRWLIQVDGGAELRLVEGQEEVAELVRMGRVSSATPVYEVGADAHALGEVLELAGVLPGRETLEPPPVRGQRSPERAALSEELAVLDRPLADDIDFYDERPPRRWSMGLGLVVVLAAAAVGGYPFVKPHLPAWQSAARAGLARLDGQRPKAAAPAPQIATATTKVTAAPAPPVAVPIDDKGAAVAPPLVVPAPAALPPAGEPTADDDGDAQATSASKPTRATRRHGARHRRPSND